MAFLKEVQMKVTSASGILIPEAIFCAVLNCFWQAFVLILKH